jgi:hypothetical protein
VDTGALVYTGPKLATMSADEFIAFLDAASAEEIDAAVTESQWLSWGSCRRPQLPVTDAISTQAVFDVLNGLHQRSHRLVFVAKVEIEEHHQPPKTRLYG